MPGNAPTADDIHAGRITFVSLDTQVIQGKQYQLDRGALGQLPSQLPKTIHLVLTQVVEAELMAHRLAQVSEEVKRVESALVTLGRQTGEDFKGVLTSFQGMKVAETLESSFGKELKDFTERCNGLILPWGMVSPDKLFQDYFRAVAPFEEGGKKKSEFPDAASLQILEGYADNNDTSGIIVSDDNGWSRYCASSSRLYHLKSLDELAALFVATGAYPDELKAKIKGLLSRPDSALYLALVEAIGDHVSDAEWDTTELFPVYSGRVEVEISSSRVAGVELFDDIEVWFDEEQNESVWIVSVTAKVEVTLEGSKYLYVWDGVDKDEVLIASEEDEFYETVEVPVYIRLSDVQLDADGEHWGVSVDIASATYALASQEIEFDMR